MTSWIDRCLEKNIIPIPTTVVPVTWSHNIINGVKIIIKRIIGRIGKIYGLSRIDSILAYNDWIKEYAQSRGLVVLDLEAALRVSPEDRYLRNELSSGDGLHLNDQAYKILDGIVLPTLEQVKWKR
jgi:lysophospholipase L1-like esterase